GRAAGAVRGAGGAVRGDATRRGDEYRVISYRGRHGRIAARVGRQEGAARPGDTRASDASRGVEGVQRVGAEPEVDTTAGDDGSCGEAAESARGPERHAGTRSR